MFSEYCISLDKLENDYYTELSLLSYMNEFSVSDLIEKGKLLIKKIVEAFKIFVKNLCNTVQKFFLKKRIEHRFKSIKRMLKTSPSYARSQVVIYFDDSHKKSRDRELLEVRNMLAKLKLKRTDPQMFRTMSQLEARLQLDYPHKTVTVEQALRYIEPELMRLDGELQESVHNLLHMVDTTKDQEDNPEVCNMISRLSNFLQKDDLKVARNAAANLNRVFCTLRLGVMKTMKRAFHDIKHIKVLNEREMRNITTKPIHWFEVNGTLVPIYRANAIHDEAGSPATTYSTLDGNKRQVIVAVYDEFFTYDKETQDAVLLHELGHVANYHMIPNQLRDFSKMQKTVQKQQKIASRRFTSDQMRQFGNNGVWTYLFTEVEADQYAINNSSDPQAAKEKLDKLLREFNNGGEIVQWARTDMR